MPVGFAVWDGAQTPAVFVDNRRSAKQSLTLVRVLVKVPVKLRTRKIRRVEATAAGALLRPPKRAVTVKAIPGAEVQAKESPKVGRPLAPVIERDLGKP